MPLPFQMNRGAGIVRIQIRRDAETGLEAGLEAGPAPARSRRGVESLVC
jgi:hypothetical protein